MPFPLLVKEIRGSEHVKVTRTQIQNLMQFVHQGCV